ncbi:MAG: FKBP-type peptidyl-prolyl cis-trans isomerase [Armatimonadetes bacterium]|nr:FKBP-type peptidyl-prolyl cis-trans isomerase [Armatimonadota bacterium]
MKLALVVLIGLTLALAFIGCGKKEEPQTEVETQTQPQTETQTEMPVAGAPAAAPGKWVTTKSGLKYRDKKVGTGPAVKEGDTVTVNYTGKLDDGTVFDSSKKPGREPFSFTVGEGSVIKGWDEGLRGMKVGGVRELKVPPPLGYGDQDMGEIPPNSTLNFEVELLKISE